MELVEGTHESLLRSSAGTDVGRRREENQDSFGLIESDNYKIYIVADGMGGAKGGAVASQLAIKTIREELKNYSTVTPDILSEIILEANDAIFQHSLEDPALSGMGTTIVVFLFVGTALHILHVGDSRAYRLRVGKLERLTEDHTLVSELVKAGAISESQAENHPVSHMLTRSLGPSTEVRVDCVTLKDGPVRGDKYLLCSDGLYNMVSPEKMREILSSKSTDEAVELLLSEANKNGGTDNITVLVVEVTENYPVGLEDISVEPIEIEEQITHSPPPVRINLRKALGAGVVVFLGGIILGSVIFNNRPIPAPNTGVLSTVKSTPPKPELEKPTISTMLYESSPELLSVVRQSETGGLGEVEKENIRRRLASVQQRLEGVNTKLSLTSVRGSIPSLVQTNSLQITTLEEALSSLKTDLDIAARTLSIWFGRKKRIEIEDPVSLSTEISISSPEVKQKRDEFDTISWNYLKAAEEFRIRPTDSTLEQRVTDLIKERSDKVRELVSVMRDAINSALSQADSSVSRLTIEQDSLMQKISRLKNDNEFLNSLQLKTDDEILGLRRELETERAALEIEARELKELLQ